jgi:putative ABC transport system permease protein
LATFAGAAVLLAAIGLYGAMSYSMEQRTAEFGLRLAVGAKPIGLLWLGLRQSLRIGLIGACIGLAVSLALARALGNALYLVPREHEGLLYGITTTDPFMLASAGLLIVSVTGLAGVVPAKRAMRIDLVAVLRDQ